MACGVQRSGSARCSIRACSRKECSRVRAAVPEHALRMQRKFALAPSMRLLCDIALRRTPIIGICEVDKRNIAANRSSNTTRATHRVAWLSLVQQ
eukprot:6190913-Pleurochrysis_carterae.AAC.1